MGHHHPCLKLLIEQALKRVPLAGWHQFGVVGKKGISPISRPEARNADEAITILERRADVRVVFTDVDMPGTMDGLRLAKYIRDRWPRSC